MPLILRQIRWQIAASYTVLIVAILAGLALVLYAQTRGTYIRTLEAGITGQAYLIATLTEAAPPGADTAYLDRLIDTVSKELAARVTLISPEGRIIADSLLPPDRYTSRSDRPEVEEALADGLGETQRYSTTTGDERFYVAVPYRREGALAGIVRVGVPLTTIAATQAQIGLAVLAAALLAITISFALAVLIARFTTRPLLELRSMAERLAAGDLDVQATVRVGEEVDALARSFNHMARRLRQLIEDQAHERERLAAILSTMHDGILILDADRQVTLANRAAAEALALTRPAPFPIRELAVGPSILEAAGDINVFEPTRLIEDLRPPASGRSLRAIVTRLGDQATAQILVMLQDLTELRRAERSRRLLLTNITHDLRTPLASLQALLDTLVDGAVDDPATAHDFLRRMDVEVQGLGRLVDEFLELSRIELGQVTLQLAPQQLPEVLHAVVGRMQAQARQKGVALAIETMASLPTIEIDRGRIEQVLLNLLQNALSFTPAGGSITVAALSWDSEVAVAVQDTGVGIGEADLPNIFERFYKADPSRSDSGIGLGLAIARHLVEHHEGRIWAESQLGVGTTVTFTLPCRPRPAR